LTSHNSELIYGLHPVEEVLRAGRRAVHRVLVSGSDRPSIEKAAKQSSVRVERVERSMLDSVSDHHQGVAAEVESYPYSELHLILEAAGAASSRALILILDQLQDPQNLGTLIRSAEAVGVDGILIPKRGAAGVTPAVVSASSGACEHLHIARVNLARAIVELKKSNVWIAGLEYDDDARDIYTAELDTPLAIVVGAEGQGLRRLVRESCDYLVRIPMQGSVGSLNAAVAGSIALYEARRLQFPSNSS
jgi:23S rRNA (guanosine2251-2'-O)-methyltransferase